jgi:2-oxoglutarate ferredoxin oxidoreductase subunit beta
MFYPEYPVPVGVLRDIDRPTHDQLVTAQIDDAIAKSGPGDLRKLLLSGETWTAS